MLVQPYLSVDGRCEEAIEFYRKALGAAMCESFFATLECELLARRRFTSQAEARWRSSATSRGGTIPPAAILASATYPRLPTRCRYSRKPERPKRHTVHQTGSTPLCGRMLRSATKHRPRKCSYQPSPRGRLRNPDQLRRPCSRWC
jgi:hypothetical protein